MAEGVRALTGSNLAVSVTGVAGPGPDDDGHPEGLVCAALAAWAATAMEVGLLRKFFGAFLIVVGLMELFGRTKE